MADSVTDYVLEYEFRGDGGDHTPTEGERALLEDAIHGYLAEHDAEARLRAWKLALESKLAEAKINCDGSDASVQYTQGVIDTYNACRSATPATKG